MTDDMADDTDRTDHTQMGVLLPSGANQWQEEVDPRRLIDFAVRAERLGFDSLWANDSLLSPRIEALTLLSALASTTERVTLGTAALMPVLRRPVQAAQALASLDLLSGGRLVLGVGAGFPGRFGKPLYELSDVPWERRFARLDDTVALWRHLWGGTDTGSGSGSDTGGRIDAGSFHGAVLHYDGLPEATPGYRPGGPPVWLGAASPGALARTGRLYDGWLPYPPDPADYASGLADVRTAAAGAGRDPAAVTPAVYVTVLVADDPERGRKDLDVYARANYGMPLAELSAIQALVSGPPETVLAELRRYTAAGARHLVVRVGAMGFTAQSEQLERIAELIGALRMPPRPHP